MAEYVCRLLAHMRSTGTPICDPGARARTSRPSRSSTSNPATCCARSTTCPKQAGALPWRLHQNYIRDIRLLRFAKVDDALAMSNPAPGWRPPGAPSPPPSDRHRLGQLTQHRCRSVSDAGASRSGPTTMSSADDLRPAHRPPPPRPRLRGSVGVHRQQSGGAADPDHRPHRRCHPQHGPVGAHRRPADRGPGHAGHGTPGRRAGQRDVIVATLLVVLAGCVLSAVVDLVRGPRCSAEDSRASVSVCCPSPWPSPAAISARVGAAGPSPSCRCRPPSAPGSDIRSPRRWPSCSELPAAYWFGAVVGGRRPGPRRCWSSPDDREGRGRAPFDLVGAVAARPGRHRRLGGPERGRHLGMDVPRYAWSSPACAWLWPACGWPTS